MVRCGELCKHCSNECREDLDLGIQIDCPYCEQAGCDRCQKSGFFTLSECPRTFIGQQMVHAINLTQNSDRFLPSAGGLLDQSNWYLDMMNTLNSDVEKIRDSKRSQDVG